VDRTVLTKGDDLLRQVLVVLDEWQDRTVFIGLLRDGIASDGGGE